MMNIRNLGWQESGGVKYIDHICAKVCLKLWFESIYVMLLSWDGFKCDPATKFKTITL